MQNVTLYRHKSKPGSEKSYKFVRRDNDETIHIPVGSLNHVSQRTLPDKFGMCVVVATVSDSYAEKNDL